MKYKKWAVSAVIVVIFSLQFFTSFRFSTYLPKVFPPAAHLNLDQYKPPYLWPFLTYPLYQHAHYRGEKITEYRAYAVLEDSTEVHVRPEDVNMGFWHFKKDFVPAMKNKAQKSIQKYASLIQDRFRKRPLHIRLESHYWSVGSDGITEDTTKVVSEISLAIDG